ncbi:hypothetical protein [Sinomicrobium oceani]|uniref:hypothetical protein n=1 Tax=Sinomicrobium oceani TaxID=1150368 RepID=UPI00227A0BEE|nr:hypothetical protein [Sinomicrobium oceani]
MKTLAIFCMGVACLALSCSPDPELNNEFHAIRMESSLTDSAKSTNTNGLAGALYNEFLTLHPLDTISGWNLNEIDLEVRSLFTEHGYELSVSSNEPPLDGDIASFLAGSTLSEPARESFLVFLDSVTNSPSVDYMLAYGVQVAQQSTWTNEDQRVILTTISLISDEEIDLFADGGDRDDEDWDIGTGNKSPTVVNTMENTSMAISLAIYYSSRHGLF